jgi:hypothetical protein
VHFVAVQGMGARAQATGYRGSFSPAPSLNDDAVRQRNVDGRGTDASSSSRLLASNTQEAPSIPNTPSPPPMFGPLVPNLNKAPQTRSNAADAERATQWLAADRRKLGGFDARFHSTGAYVPRSG